MLFEIETDENADDLKWPVTLGECITLVAGCLIALICIGLLAAWILAYIAMLVFKP